MVSPASPYFRIAMICSSLCGVPFLWVPFPGLGELNDVFRRLGHSHRMCHSPCSSRGLNRRKMSYPSCGIAVQWRVNLDVGVMDFDDETAVRTASLPKPGQNQREIFVRLWLCVLFLVASTSAQAFQPTWDSIDHRPTPAWFNEAKFGIFIHWGVYSVPAYAPVLPGKLAYAEWYWNAMTHGRDDPKADAIQKGTWDFHRKTFGADFPYQSLAPLFKAELFDPEHWAEVFSHSGAKYVVLTSKHHDGFALWPSGEASATWGRPWNAVVTGPKRDLLGDLTDAVRRKGLRMGFYYSLYEWYNPLWLSDKQRYIAQHMIPQFKDVVTRYKPDIIFADGEWDLTSSEWHTPEMLAWLFNESPVKDTVVINDRWGKDTRH